MEGGAVLSEKVAFFFFFFLGDISLLTSPPASGRQGSKGEAVCQKGSIGAEI